MFFRNLCLAFLIVIIPLLVGNPAASSPKPPAVSVKKTNTRIQSPDDLPLEIVSAAHSKKDILAVLLTGDGGWAELVRSVAFGLSQEGVPVAGLNSLSYFWHSRSPAEAARDLNRIATWYLERWNKNNVLLIGYSFGADVLPFMIARLPKDTAKRIMGVVLISPSHQADFEIHILSHIGLKSEDEDYPVLQELRKIKRYPSLCMAGMEETGCLCRDHGLPWLKTVLLPGGHHLGGNYSEIVSTILSRFALKGASH